MATTVANIHIGQGEVWIGGTAPSAGTDPLSPVTGTPSALNAMTTNFAAPSSGGTYVGFTNGAATVTYRPTFYMVETEQTMAEVVAFPTSEEMTVAFTMLEATYLNLAAAFGQGTTRAASGPPVANVVYVGSKSTLATQVVVLMSRKRSGTGYFILTIYAGYSSEGTTFNYERRAEQRIATTVKALADTTRPQGDQLFQLIEYPANPA